MFGEVEVYYGGELVLREHNMIVSGAGEIIVDVLTTSPDLSGIASASAILDTSNYVPRAITLGTDGSSYQMHGHNYLFSSVVSDGFIRVLNYEQTSSYSPSTTISILRTKNLVKAPAPMDTRCEENSTDLAFDLSALNLDLGHNLNLIPFRGTLGDNVLLAGCYPAGSGTNYAIFSATPYNSSPVVSGILSGVFNGVNSIDPFGFIYLQTSTASYGGGLTSHNVSGLFVSAASDFSSTGKITYILDVANGDLASLSLFGGITVVGLWCFNLLEMVKEGRLPPYTFENDNLVLPLRYKLFSKKVFSRDITRIIDYDTSSSGFVSCADANNTANLSLWWNLNYV